MVSSDLFEDRSASSPACTPSISCLRSLTTAIILALSRHYFSDCVSLDQRIPEKTRNSSTRGLSEMDTCIQHFFPNIAPASEVYRHIWPVENLEHFLVGRILTSSKRRPFSLGQLHSFAGWIFL